MCGDDAVDDIERTRQVKNVLFHFDQNFTKYLAATIGLTEKLPEEVNNQIRNAMTHLARAQVAPTQSALGDEVSKAKSHIDRANRDCLKASIIVAREKLDNLVAEARFYHAGLTPELQTRLKNIAEDRQEAYKAEAQGRADIVVCLEKLLADIMFASDIIQETYREAGSKKAKLTRFLFRWYRPAFTLVALVIGYVTRPFTQPIVDWLKVLLSHHA